MLIFDHFDFRQLHQCRRHHLKIQEDSVKQGQHVYGIKRVRNLKQNLRIKCKHLKRKYFNPFQQSKASNSHFGPFHYHDRLVILIKSFSQWHLKLCSFPCSCPTLNFFAHLSPLSSIHHFSRLLSSFLNVYYFLPFQVSTVPLWNPYSVVNTIPYIFNI